MKSFYITVIISFIFIIAACSHKIAGTQSTAINKTAIDKRGNLILLGKTTRERLTQPPFGEWYTKNFDIYSIDSTTANQIKPLVKNKQFLLFMGTWCGDSRREVPRMYRLLDYCNVKALQVQLINLNNSDTAYKQSPEHEERGLNILRVPTLIVLEGQKEVGRIVESPMTSLEKDLLAIVTGQPYEHKYKQLTNAPSGNRADTSRSQPAVRQ